MVASGALLVLIALAFAVGRYPVSLSRDLLACCSGSRSAPNVETVVLQVRGPRVLAALLVGAALAAAGTAYQGMFRNPLVSPDILGVSTGAALGAVLGIFLSQGDPVHPDLRLRRRARRGRPGVLDRLAPARPRPAARAGADRRGDRHAARLGDRAAQVPRRSLQPAAGDHLLAARQPRRDLSQGPPRRRSADPRGPRADAAAALAHEPARAARRRSARARRRHAQAAHAGGGLRRR